MPVIQRDVDVTAEVVGEVTAVREIPLHSQVTGWLQKILFRPGQRVAENQLLFVIDPRPSEAALTQARGALADAQAAAARARQDVARYEPLLPYNAIPKATYDAAVATLRSAQATVEQRKAAVTRAELDLRNTEVRSPVNGQIGAQQVEIGGLVSAGQTALATVSTLDPVYVTVNIPETQYVRYMKAHGSREAAAREAREASFHLSLPDGSDYPLPGRFDFVAPGVSAQTGTLAVRLQFPNPDYLLRPGMDVRVQLVLDHVQNALLVPQKAVTQLLGRDFVTVIGADDKAAQRPVELGERVGALWIVQSGLKPGERVVVEGTQKAQPGARVAAKMITEAELEGAARSPAAGGTR